MKNVTLINIILGAACSVSGAVIYHKISTTYPTSSFPLNPNISAAEKYELASNHSFMSTNIAFPSIGNFSLSGTSPGYSAHFKKQGRLTNSTTAPFSEKMDILPVAHHPFSFKESEFHSKPFPSQSDSFFKAGQAPLLISPSVTPVSLASPIPSLSEFAQAQVDPFLHSPGENPTPLTEHTKTRSNTGEPITEPLARQPEANEPLMALPIRQVEPDEVLIDLPARQAEAEVPPPLVAIPLVIAPLPLENDRPIIQAPQPAHQRGTVPPPRGSGPGKIHRPRLPHITTATIEGDGYPPAMPKRKSLGKRPLSSSHRPKGCYSHYPLSIGQTLEWIEEESLLDAPQVAPLIESLPSSLRGEVILRLGSIKPDTDLTLALEAEQKTRATLELVINATERRSTILEKRIAQRAKDLHFIQSSPSLDEIVDYYFKTNDYETLSQSLLAGDIEGRDIYLNNLIAAHPISKKKQTAFDNFIQLYTEESFHKIKDSFTALGEEDKAILLRSYFYRIIINGEIIANADYHVSLIDELCDSEQAALLYKMKELGHHIRNPHYMKRFQFYMVLKEKVSQLFIDVSPRFSEEVQIQKKDLNKSTEPFMYLHQQKRAELKAILQKEKVASFLEEHYRKVRGDFERLLPEEQNRLINPDEFRTYNAAYCLLVGQYPSQKEDLEPFLLNYLSLKDLTHQELISLRYVLERDTDLLDFIKSSRRLKWIWQHISETTNPLISIISRLNESLVVVQPSKKFVDEPNFRKLRNLKPEAIKKEETASTSTKSEEKTAPPFPPSPPLAPPPPASQIMMTIPLNEGGARSAMLQELVRKAAARDKSKATLESPDTDKTDTKTATLEEFIDCVVSHLKLKKLVEKMEESLEEKLRIWDKGYATTAVSSSGSSSKKDPIKDRIKFHQLQQEYMMHLEERDNSAAQGKLALKMDRKLAAIQLARKIAIKNEDKLYGQALMPIRSVFLNRMRGFFIQDKENARILGKELEAVAVDREEEESPIFEVEGTETLSKDPDARWLKKGKKSYFGYKGFMIVDQEDGYIDQVHVTPAHVSEVKELEKIIENRQDERLYGDKGYASKSNKDLLKSKGIKNGLMEKAKKKKPLTHWQKVFNRLISKVRYRVEQGFGTLKRRFKLTRASYFTTPKVHGQMAIKAMALNLLKALNKTRFRQQTPSLRLV